VVEVVLIVVVEVGVVVVEVVVVRGATDEYVNQIISRTEFCSV